MGKKKWHVYASVTGTKYIGLFEAETDQGAKDLANHKAHISLCHQCADEVEGPEIAEFYAEPAEE